MRQETMASENWFQKILNVIFNEEEKRAGIMQDVRLLDHLSRARRVKLCRESFTFFAISK